jgi:hypothetical protein
MVSDGVLGGAASLCWSDLPHVLANSAFSVLNCFVSKHHMRSQVNGDGRSLCQVCLGNWCRLPQVATADAANA